MGTRERKQREFEQREALLLDTAACMIADDSVLDQLDIRKPERLLYRQVQVYLNGPNWQPLIAAGPGAGARFSMGLVIAAGMTVGTLFTLFVVPAFCLAVAAERKATEDPSTEPAATQPG